MPAVLSMDFFEQLAKSPCGSYFLKPPQNIFVRSMRTFNVVRRLGWVQLGRGFASLELVIGSGSRVVRVGTAEGLIGAKTEA